MFNMKKKVLISALSLGFLLGGTGIWSVSNSEAANYSGGYQRGFQPFIGIQQTGMGGPGQLKIGPQFTTQIQQKQQQQQQQPKQQVPNSPQFNQQQSNQQQSNQQQFNQQQPNQQQFNCGQFVQTGQNISMVGSNIISQVADILDVDEDTIWEALQDGQSLLEIAEDYDVSEDDLLDQLEDLQSDAIEDAVDEGTITEEQAEHLQDQLTERLEQMINATFDN